jgi:hypothetical protein
MRKSDPAGCDTSDASPRIRAGYPEGGPVMFKNEPSGCPEGLQHEHGGRPAGFNEPGRYTPEGLQHEHSARPAGFNEPGRYTPEGLQHGYTAYPGGYQSEPSEYPTTLDSEPSDTPERLPLLATKPRDHNARVPQLPQIDEHAAWAAADQDPPPCTAAWAPRDLGPYHLLPNQEPQAGYLPPGIWDGLEDY